MPDEVIVCKCGHEHDAHECGSGPCLECPCQTFRVFDMANARIDKFDFKKCPKCGSMMAHYRLHGYRCARGCER